jgi:spermidine synthase
MSAFKELAHSYTPMGELSLRRRRLPTAEYDIFEIKLGDDFLMSSRFTEGEIALAELALREVHHQEIDVVVGGLGLGFTARAALRDDRVYSLCVVEAMAEVIEWHRQDIVPFGTALITDVRCQLLHGDFFKMFGIPHRERYPDVPGRKFHAMLLDIDHSPQCVLAESHRPFYEAEGLGAAATHLHPGGVFGLWSNDPPDERFLSVFQAVFEQAEAHVVDISKPLQPQPPPTNTIYVGRAPDGLPRTHRPPS